MNLSVLLQKNSMRTVALSSIHWRNDNREDSPHIQSDLQVNRGSVSTTGSNTHNDRMRSSHGEDPIFGEAWPACWTILLPHTQYLRQPVQGSVQKRQSNLFHSREPWIFWSCTPWKQSECSEPFQEPASRAEDILPLMSSPLSSL